MTSRRVPEPALHHGPGDATRYHRVGLAYLLALYAVLAALLAGAGPSWLLLLAVPVLYVRAALTAHELMHIRAPQHVTWLLRLMLVFEAPLCLGFREYQDIHARHHRHAGTAEDPEFYQIRGGHLRALGNALISSERALHQWVRAHGLDRPLARDLALRAAAFGMALWINPPAFLAFWITVRLSVGVSSYCFHHALHYRDGRYGTFPLAPGPVLHRLGTLVLGRDRLNLLLEHDAHHTWQTVHMQHLPGLLDRYPAPPAWTRDVASRGVGS